MRTWQVLHILNGRSERVWGQSRSEVLLLKGRKAFGSYWKNPRQKAQTPGLRSCQRGPPALWHLQAPEGLSVVSSATTLPSHESQLLLLVNSPFPAPRASEGLPITLPYPMDQRMGTWYKLDLSQSPSPWTTITAQRWVSQRLLWISLSSSTSWRSALSFDMAKFCCLVTEVLVAQWCPTLCNPMD